MQNFDLDTEHPISIPSGDVKLEGILHIPKVTKGLIIFAHGSGSGRLSPRNQHVASELQKHQFATLLFDLLTAEEDEVDKTTSEYRFDIDLLAERLGDVTKWIQHNPVLKSLPIGFYGASTGAAAALIAAARLQANIKAVVSRGGRADLAGESLAYVNAATLLIVGGDDDAVIPLNEQAREQMKCVNELKIVTGATHLFEEPGKMDEVVALSTSWFNEYVI